MSEYATREAAPAPASSSSTYSDQFARAMRAVRDEENASQRSGSLTPENKALEDAAAAIRRDIAKDPMAAALGLRGMPESDLASPWLARRLVARIGQLSPEQKNELRDRLAAHEGGRRDELAAKIARTDPAVRRLVKRAVKMGPELAVVLGPEIAALEASLTNDEPSFVPANPSKYLDRHQARITFELARAVSEQPPALHPRLSWTISGERFAEELEKALGLVQKTFDSFAQMLVAIFHPVDVKTYIATSLDGVDDTRWRGEIAAYLVQLLRGSFAVSTQRIGLRVVAQADEHPEISDDRVIASSPLDRVVREMVFADGTITYRPRNKREASASSDRGAFAKGLRWVVYEELGSRDASLWNWVKVTKPSDPTPEEVAATVFRDLDNASDKAHAIIDKSPYFAIPVQLAWRIPTLARHASREAFSTADQGTLAEGRSRDLAALAASDIGKDLARTTPKSPPPSQSEQRDLGDVVRLGIAQLDELDNQLAPLHLSDRLSPARTWLRELRAQPAPVLEHWSAPLLAQRAVLSRAVASLRSVLAAGGSGIPEVSAVIADMASAAGSSHIAPFALQMLDDAERRARDIPMLLLRNAVVAARTSSNELYRATDSQSDKTLVRSEQRDIDAQLDALIKAGPNIDPAAYTALATDVQAQMIAVRVRMLRVQSGQLRAALADASSGAVGYFANLGHHDDLDALSAKLALVIAHADEIDAELQREMIAIGIADFTGHPDPEAYRTSRRAAQVAASRARLDTLVQKENIGATFERAINLADEAARRTAWGKLILDVAVLIGISIVSAGIAGVATGVVRSYMLADLAVGSAAFIRAARVARVAGAAAGFVTETTVNAVGQTAITGDSLGMSFADNAVSNLLTAGVMAPFRRLVSRIADTERGVVALWKAGKRGQAIVLAGPVFSAEVLINMGVGITSARLVRGEGAEAATDPVAWAQQGVSVATGHLVARRLSSLASRLQQYGERGVHLRKRAKAQRKLAEQLAQHGGNLDAQLEVLAGYHTLLSEERTLLLSGEAVRRALDPEQLATLQEGNASSTAHKDSVADPIVALYLEGLRPASEDGIEWYGSIERVHLGLEASNATDIVRSPNVIRATIDGVPRTFYLIDSESGSTAYDRLTRVGAKVTPANVDPARKQWNVTLGDKALGVHEAPRTGRVPASTPAKTADDTARAQRQAELDRAAFEVWQQHIQAVIEGKPFVYSTTLQLGFGPAGVLDQALQSPAHGQRDVGDRLIVSRDLTSVLETRGKQRIGQHRDALDSPAIPVAEHSLAKEGEFVTSDEFADAMTRARARLQANVLQGTAGGVEFRSRVDPAAWEEPKASMRVPVVTANGHRIYIYASEIHQTTGPGGPRVDPIRNAMTPETFEQGTRDHTLLAGADLDALKHLKAGARILSVPGSPTADWMAEAAAMLGPGGHVELVGDVPYASWGEYKKLVEDAIASGDPQRLVAVRDEIERAAHMGLSLPRNKALRDSFPDDRLSITTGRLDTVERLPDGRYRVTFKSITGEADRSAIYDQIVYAYGQTKAAELEARFGKGADRADPKAEVPAGSIALEMVMHDGHYVGLRAIGTDYFIPGPVASPDYAPWVNAKQRDDWKALVKQMGAPGSTTRDYGPITRDSYGVADGLEMQRDRGSLAVEHRALEKYELPGLNVVLHLGADRAKWQQQLTAFFRSQLPATPEDKIHVHPRGVVGNESARFEVVTAGHSLGFIKLFADGRQLDAEVAMHDAFKDLKLKQLGFTTTRKQLGLDEASGQERALLVGSLPGRTIADHAVDRPSDAAERMQRMTDGVTYVAHGLAELHTTKPTTSPAAREQRRVDAEAELAALYMNPSTVLAVGGVERLRRIERELRDQLLAPYLAANIPLARTHGTANVNTFSVALQEGRMRAVTTDLAHSRERGDISGDVASFVASIDELSSLSAAEREFLKSAFVRRYTNSLKDAGVVLSGADVMASVRWHSALAALHNATTGQHRITQLEAELGLTTGDTHD